MVEWSRSRSSRLNLDFEILMNIAERRWNYGIFEGTYFSIHPVKVDNEINERYGDYFYTQRGVVRGTASITDNSGSIYLPAIYQVDEVKIKPAMDNEIRQLVSYEGLFCNLFENGERVDFEGVLEKVTGNQEEYYRVVIGSSGFGGGFIAPTRADL
jgi:predicted nucleotidyltransferase